MRYLTLLLTVSLAVPMYASKSASQLVTPPIGSTLPVALTRAVKPGQLVVGQPVIARFIQRVPVSSNSYLPDKVEVAGKVVSYNSSAFSILFTELRWRGRAVPIHLQLVSAASSSNVFQTTMPVGGTDRGTSSPADWTTQQVGGDEVYRSAGWGKVYDQYSQPVGYADLNGVYQDPSSASEPAHAMGPFSTTATGLYGLADFSIVSVGAADVPITFSVNKPKWQMANGTALLLKVIP